MVELHQDKLKKFIGILIIILILITILLFMGIIYLQNSITIVKIDTIKKNEIQEILYIKNNGSELQLYMPIIKMAQYFGYEGYTGDYINKQEDKEKCYVTSENETVMFTLNSNEIVKKSIDSEDEYIIIDEEIFEKDGELYITVEGFQKAFNVIISYDNKFKNIDIYTMNYLLSYYANAKQIQNYSTDFTNKKAILKNMIIVQDNGQYGVINAVTGETVLESKYQEISYLPITEEFLVKSNGKYGIIARDATIKIRTIYDKIKIIDNKKLLYLVKQNNFYGVIDNNGEIVVKPEYKQVGINIDKYTLNGVENSYILLDEIIAIQNNSGLWGFFDINGKQVTDFKYTGIGCTSLVENNSYPALVIPNHKFIIVENNGYYNLITIEGKQLVAENQVNSVYLKINSETNENEYFIAYNEKVANIEALVKSIEK